MVAEVAAEVEALRPAKRAEALARLEEQEAASAATAAAFPAKSLPPPPPSPPPPPPPEEAPDPEELARAQEAAEEELRRQRLQGWSTGRPSAALSSALPPARRDLGATPTRVRARGCVRPARVARAACAAEAPRPLTLPGRGRCCSTLSPGRAVGQARLSASFGLEERADQRRLPRGSAGSRPPPQHHPFRTTCQEASPVPPCPFFTAFHVHPSCRPRPFSRPRFAPFGSSDRRCCPPRPRAQHALHCSHPRAARVRKPSSAPLVHSGGGVRQPPAFVEGGGTAAGAPGGGGAAAANRAHRDRTGDVLVHATEQTACPYSLPHSYLLLPPFFLPQTSHHPRGSGRRCRCSRPLSLRMTPSPPAAAAAPVAASAAPSRRAQKWRSGRGSRRRSAATGSWRPPIRRSSRRSSSGRALRLARSCPSACSPAKVARAGPQRPALAASCA
jgi:hypothetical protein